MDQTLQAQIETYVSRLAVLIRHGRELGDALKQDPADASALTSLRIWQQDCGLTVNELSGSSKAHWLARAFSEAFLLRSAAGNAAEGAMPAEIVQRLLDVLDQAVASLSMENTASILSASREAPPPRVFQFVHNAELRSVVEQALIDSRRAYEQERYHAALCTTCGILEAIVTDALEHAGLSALSRQSAPPPGQISEWSFETRLAVAEKNRLIRSGWARLPEVAWTYRDNGERGPNTAVSERDARVAAQVLKVMMRDLDPGR
jgi:hypothetical protein